MTSVYRKITAKNHAVRNLKQSNAYVKTSQFFDVKNNKSTSGNNLRTALHKQLLNYSGVIAYFAFAIILNDSNECAHS